VPRGTLIVDDVEARAVVPEELRYTPDHEWVLASAEEATAQADSTAITVRIGITDFAQTQLGDIVHVELPGVGDSVLRGDAVGEVESTKSVSEVFTPVAGEVVARNDALESSPELVNSDPYGEGWMIEIKLADASAMDSLLSAEDYRILIEEDGSPEP
jgi:glycine cleavage system H protein